MTIFLQSILANTVGSLRAYALGLIAFMTIKIFAPGYYARQNTSTPVRIGIIAMTTNMVLNIVFYLNGFAHVGLAMATSLAAFVNAGLLWFGLFKEDVFRFQAGWIRFLMQLVLANGAMTLFLVQFADSSGAWSDLSIGSQIAQLSVLVLGAIVIYTAMLRLTGLRWQHIYR